MFGVTLFFFEHPVIIDTFMHDVIQQITLILTNRIVIVGSEILIIIYSQRKDAMESISWVIY